MIRSCARGRSGVAWPVVAGIEGHTRDIGASRERRRCPEMDTWQRRELGAVVALQLLDGKGQGPPHFVEEVHARALVLLAVKPKDAKARAVIDGGVLVRLPSGELDDLHVHLDGGP
jgi:hypothetical protein